MCVCVCVREGRRRRRGGGGRRGTSSRTVTAYWSKMRHLDASTNTDTTLIAAVDEASFST